MSILVKAALAAASAASTTLQGSPTKVNTVRLVDWRAGRRRGRGRDRVGEEEEREKRRGRG